jgi:hypothetical protein
MDTSHSDAVDPVPQPIPPPAGSGIDLPRFETRRLKGPEAARFANVVLNSYPEAFISQISEATDRSRSAVRNVLTANGVTIWPPGRRPGTGRKNQTDASGPLPASSFHLVALGHSWGLFHDQDAAVRGEHPRTAS